MQHHHNMKKISFITSLLILTLVLFIALFGITHTYVQAAQVDPSAGTPTNPSQGTPTNPPEGTPTNPPQGTPTNPGDFSVPSPSSNLSSLPAVLNVIITIVTEVGSIIAVLFIIWSGFLFIQAQGNPEKIKKAKMTFFTTIIGTALLLGGSVIANIVLNTVTSITK